MAAYVVIQVEVLDPEQYAPYRAASTTALAAAGGEFIVRGGDVEVLEGDPPPGRTVVLRFPSMDAARAWYHSDAYQTARRLREGAARMDAYIVDGLD
jgi:uncharacterized protein (DUF1330 family)